MPATIWRGTGREFNATRSVTNPTLGAEPPAPAAATTAAAMAGQCTVARSPGSGLGVRRRHDRVEPYETGGRPQGFHVVVDLERRRRVRERDPAQLRPGEDMDVRHNARGLVERTAADEPHLGT